ncbi:hypothetical protein glysoja_011095 [Glycine soja]|nr:hypothetical protein glysoja_011095 [Glycine soja]
MAFASFLGRVLFASVFILSAYQEDIILKLEYEIIRCGFGGVDGVGCFACVVLTFHVDLETKLKFLIAGAIALKGLGGVLFIFGSSFGALLLLLHQLIATPIHYDFYNYDSEDKEFTQLFIKFTQNMALFGALLFCSIGPLSLGVVVSWFFIISSPICQDFG